MIASPSAVGPDLDRRGFLRGGLKAALAGTRCGLLLPWQGGNAFALPTDLGTAADLPVRAMPLPVSKECLQLREIIERQREFYRKRPAGDGFGRDWFLDGTVDKIEHHRKDEVVTSLGGRPVA